MITEEYQLGSMAVSNTLILWFYWIFLDCIFPVPKFDAVSLFCSVLPYIIPFSLDEEVNTGDSVQLNCHVSKGDKPIKITWNFHGEELSSHMGIMTTKVGDRSSILSITSAMAAHSGNYTCSAQNPAGISSYTAAVHVNGTPLFSFLLSNFLRPGLNSWQLRFSPTYS